MRRAPDRLDGKTYEATPEMSVIADADGERRSAWAA